MLNPIRAGETNSHPKQASRRFSVINRFFGSFTVGFICVLCSFQILSINTCCYVVITSVSIFYCVLWNGRNKLVYFSNVTLKTYLSPRYTDSVYSNGTPAPSYAVRVILSTGAPALIWSWHRRLQTDWVLSLFRSRSHGMQKIWN